jgi:hypothetical protein
MNFVILTKTEWALLCAQGSVDILSERFAGAEDALTAAPDALAWSLFSRAPRYVSGDANGMIAAQIDGESSPPLERPLTRLLKLSAVRSFFALTSSAQRHLSEDASRRNVRLSEPIFEAQWRTWTDEQRRILRVRGSKELVRLMGLEGALDWSEELGLLGEPHQSDLGVYDSLASRLQIDARQVISDDRARATEGSCAHAVVSATLWASHICGRDIPAEGALLTSEIGTLYDQLVEAQYGKIDHLSRSLHTRLEHLRLEAAEAFGSYVSPISVGIFFRFLIASRFGPLPQPTDIVSAILRLRVLDGDKVAASCCYLVGLELTPEFVQQIVSFLAPSPTSLIAAPEGGVSPETVTLDTMMEAAARVPDHHEQPPAKVELTASPNPSSDASSGAGSPNDCRDSSEPENSNLSQPATPKD